MNEGSDKVATALFGCMVALGLNACSAPPESNVDAPAPPALATNGLPQDILEAVRAALAADGGTADRARLVRAERTTFNDGSLGCPEPGMFYTMAIVEGYRVVFEADGETFDYRVNRQGAVKRCKPGDKEARPSPPSMG